MLTTRAHLLPSVPTMLIDEQRGDVTEMIEALLEAGDRVAAESPAVIVAVSARWASTGPFHADDAARHRSVVDLPGFGVEPRYDCPGQPALARAIVERALAAGLHAATARHGVDSGVSVPLHFFARGVRTPVVPVSIAGGSIESHRAWGEAIRHALDAWPERVAFVVGGALSWHLHAFNLRREVPECGELDARVLAAMKQAHWDELAAIAAQLGERARPEADLRHLEVLRGFLLLGSASGRVIERESLPGIGTALVEFRLEANGGDAGR
jgi:aromatic ring-opening dioxygenase catalytic subunit (LigB family)